MITTATEIMIITRTYIRPNLDVVWWNEIIPQSLKDHYKTNYIDTGKMLGERFEFSNDGLYMFYITEFAISMDIMKEWTFDIIILMWKKIRSNYCEQVGIIEILPVRYDYKNIETGETFEFSQTEIEETARLVQESNTQTNTSNSL
ncbi:MAG: hypothetical protein EBV10_02650 [Synechococcaceae bacterium WB6_1A_059]|nr:hypothetical protein [Synechococcaceae bacterium WB6_1A_059]